MKYGKMKYVFGFGLLLGPRARWAYAYVGSHMMWLWGWRDEFAVFDAKAKVYRYDYERMNKVAS